MTAAYRLKGVGWLIAAVAIALGFYLVSLRVAEERKRLESVNVRIATAQRDIRALETEFDTRANLVQLERWNGDTLALASPTAGQFVHDAAQLAAIDVNAVGVAPVRTAALVVPAAVVAPSDVTPPAVAAAAPAVTAAPVRVAVAPAPVAAPLDPAARVAVGRTVVVRTAVVRAGAIRAVAVHAAPSPISARAMARLASAERATQAVSRVRPQAVAMLDDKLLSDATLGDLLAKAKREARYAGGSTR